MLRVKNKKVIVQPNTFGLEYAIFASLTNVIYIAMLREVCKAALWIHSSEVLRKNDVKSFIPHMCTPRDDNLQQSLIGDLKNNFK